jgi:AraC family transcriptional regulator, regulatory protein of adaptative response / DNA-3-methyladenine glycosylase II
VFFTGVLSTGIYCRPVCPSRVPLLKNCRFFANAAEAEAEGFRPCLRCRPELAPAVFDASRSALARRLGERLRDADGAAATLEELARESGVGARHLRRLFQREWGLPPVAYAQTQRLLFAKRLLHETTLPLIDVAFSAGFRSVRRFNALFQARYRLTPGALRREVRTDSESASAMAGEPVLQLRLEYREPIAWDALLGFLAARATPGVECVADDAYWRTVEIEGHRGWLRVGRDPNRPALVATVPVSLAPVLRPVLSRVRRMFDLDAQPEVIERHLRADPFLRRLIEDDATARGLRVPGCWDGFELAVRAVLGQQITVAAATTLAGRVAAKLGRPADFTVPRDELRLLSPSASACVSARTDMLGRLGLIRTRADTIRELARAVNEGRLDLEGGADPVATVERLLTLRGIGRWTAEYVALRVLRWPDAFPEGDLALQQAAGEWGERLSASALSRRAEAWRPWRGYAAVLLWHHHGRQKALNSARPGSKSTQPPRPTRIPRQSKSLIHSPSRT